MEATSRYGRKRKPSERTVSGTPEAPKAGRKKGGTTTSSKKPRTGQANTSGQHPFPDGPHLDTPHNHPPASTSQSVPQNLGSMAEWAGFIQNTVAATLRSAGLSVPSAPSNHTGAIAPCDDSQHQVVTDQPRPSTSAAPGGTQIFPSPFTAVPSVTQFSPTPATAVPVGTQSPLPPQTVPVPPPQATPGGTQPPLPLQSMPGGMQPLSQPQTMPGRTQPPPPPQAMPGGMQPPTPPQAVPGGIPQPPPLQAMPGGSQPTPPPPPHAMPHGMQPPPPLLAVPGGTQPPTTPLAVPGGTQPASLGGSEPSLNPSHTALGGMLHTAAPTLAAPVGMQHYPAPAQAAPGGVNPYSAPVQAVPVDTLHPPTTPGYPPAHMTAVPGHPLYPPAHAQHYGQMAAAPVLQPHQTAGTSAGYNMIVDMRPLDAQVDPKIKAKIWQDEYINLATLIQPVRQSSSHQSKPLTLDEDGNIAPRESPKGMINSIVQWNEAWRVYMIVSLANPSHTPEQNSAMASQVIHYMHFINKLYASGADYLYYDENFRQYRQYNPTPYCSVDHCLQMEAQSLGKPAHPRGPPNTTSRPTFPRPHLQGSQVKPHPSLSEARAKLREFNIPRGYCYLFLASLPCYEKQCTYKHLCPLCGAKHAIDRCHKNTTQTSQRHNGRGTVRPLMDTPARYPNTMHSVHKRQWLNTSPTPASLVMQPPPPPPLRSVQGNTQLSPPPMHAVPGGTQLSPHPVHAVPGDTQLSPHPVHAVPGDTHLPQPPVHAVPNDKQLPLPPSLKQSVPPVINIKMLQDLLILFDPIEAEKITSGFRHGFDLGYSGPITNVVTKNLTSALRQPQIMQTLLQHEVNQGRFLGPFQEKPFHIMRINPIGFVPKKTPNSYRLISDLSQPRGNSVNDDIPPVASKVAYPSIQDAIDCILSLVKSGHTPMLSKLDVKSAFRLIPLNSSQFPLMGVYFSGNYYIDAFLPMGASSSCRIYQDFSNAFTHILMHHGNIQHVISYLDDHLIISECPETALRDLTSFQHLAAKINLPLAHDKTAGPASTLEFLGIELDTRKLEARLPPEKITKAQTLIHKVLNASKIHKKKLESLHGYLNFCASIIPSGRTFIRSLSKLMHSNSPWVSISSQIRGDLQIWLEFLEDFNGKAMFLSSAPDPPQSLTLGSDSSGSWGCGAIFEGEYFSLEWPSSIPRNNLALLEFYPIVLATHVWDTKMSNKSISISCDNIAVVYIINKLKSQDPTIMKLLRIFTLQCLKLNIWFQASHIGTRANVGPDALSRGQLTSFRRSFPDLTPAQLSIPAHLRPENCLTPWTCLPTQQWQNRHIQHTNEPGLFSLFLLRPPSSHALCLFPPTHLLYLLHIYINTICQLPPSGHISQPWLTTTKWPGTHLPLTHFLLVN